MEELVHDGSSHGAAEFDSLGGAEISFDKGGAEEGNKEGGEGGFVFGIPEGVRGAGVGFTEAICGGGIGYGNGGADIREAWESIDGIVEKSETRWRVVAERRIGTDKIHVMRVAKAFAEFLDLGIDIELSGLDEDEIRFHDIFKVDVRALFDDDGCPGGDGFGE